MLNNSGLCPELLLQAMKWLVKFVVVVVVVVVVSIVNKDTDNTKGLLTWSLFSGYNCITALAPLR